MTNTLKIFIIVNDYLQIKRHINWYKYLKTKKIIFCKSLKLSIQEAYELSLALSGN